MESPRGGWSSGVRSPPWMYSKADSEAAPSAPAYAIVKSLPRRPYPRGSLYGLVCIELRISVEFGAGGSSSWALMTLAEVK